MQLTQFSDYSLRLVLYLAVNRDRVVPIAEVSEAYGISQHHLVKIVQRLVAEGIVASVRGRSGGLRLNRDPADINVGRLIRVTEPHFNLVECFDGATNRCSIDPVCGLKGALNRAMGAFLKVLDGYSLADFLPRRDALLKIWRHSREAASAR